MSDIKRVNQLPAYMYIKMNKGDTFERNLDYDIDLTGYTFEAKLYNKSKTIDIDLTVTDVDLANGQIKVTLTSTQSDTLSEGSYEWYLAGTISGERRTHIAGQVQISEGN